MNSRPRVVLAVLVAVAVMVVTVTALRAPARRQARAEAWLRVVLPEVRFDGVSFEQAVEVLRRQSGATIVIDPRLLVEGAFRHPVDLRLRDVTLQRAVSTLARYVASGSDDFDVICLVHDGRIVLTSSDVAGRYVFARVYDLRGIEFDVPKAEPFVFQSLAASPQTEPSGGLFVDRSGPPPALTREEQDDELASLVRETVYPEVWYENGGNLASMLALGGRLMVVADWEVHGAIEDLLAQLREPPAEE